MNITQVPFPPNRVGDSPTTPPPNLQPMASPALGRALKAVFFREFQPFLIVVACAWLVTAVVAAWLIILEHNLQFARGPFQNTSSLLMLQVLTIAGFPILGLAIGILQARRDVAADMWAFVAHRPVSRRFLFAGRVLAGLALYGLSAAVPLVALAVHAANNDSHFPFQWQWMLPSIADALTGIIFYFAAQIAVQRATTVFVSNLMPLVVATGCTVVMAVQYEFYQAALIFAGASAVLAWAALGTAQTQGYRLGGARGARWAMGAILLAGMGSLFLIGSQAAFQYSLYAADEAASREQRVAPGTYRPKQITYYCLFADGTFGRRIDSRPPNPPENNADPAAQYRNERLWPVKEDLADDSYKMVTQGVYMGTSPYRAGFRELRWVSQQLTEPVAASATSPLAKENLNSPSDAASSVLPTYRIKERWFYLWPPGIWYGYDGATQAYLGSFGLDGFAPPGKSATPLGPDSGYGSATTAQGVYDVNPTARSVTLRWAIPPGETPVYFRGPQTGDADPNNQNNLGDSNHALIQTKTSLIVYKQGNPQPEISIPLALSPDKASLKVRHFVDQHRWALWYVPRDDREQANVLEIFDDQGKHLTRLEIPETRTIDWYGAAPPAFVTELAPILRRTAFWQGLFYTLGGLPWNLAIEYARPRWMPSNDPTWLGWIESIGHIYYWTIGITLAATATGMWLLARRYNLRHKWAWAAGALIFGPVMLFVLAATHVLPRRVKCGSCGKLRFPAAPTCACCGAAWPEPPRNGTEVFAAVATAGN